MRYQEQSVELPGQFGFCFSDLRFETCPVTALSLRGHPYTRWIDYGMPAIAPQFLNCIFFLYKSRADALAGKRLGGTGFLIAMPTDDSLGHHYGVTNWHVAIKLGYSVIRLNTTIGVEILEFDSSDWHYLSDGTDIAVIPLSLRAPEYFTYFIGTQIFMPEERIARGDFGPGDDVFMMGRFVDLEENEKNIPALRFGNISTVPVVVKRKGYKPAMYYCLDVHSRTGYSGSPVFTYRTPGSDLTWAVTGKPTSLTSSKMLFLGIHCGQFPERMQIKRGMVTEESSIEDKEYVEGLSGMTIAAPSWKILELLNTELLVKQREAVEKKRKAGYEPVLPLEESEGNINSNAGDKLLRRMLNTSPKPTSKRGTKVKKKVRG